MSDTLKPCPFCGGEASKMEGLKGYKVQCSRRDADCPVNMRTRYHPNFSSAVDQWNTRAAPTVKPLVWGDFDASANYPSCSALGMGGLFYKIDKGSHHASRNPFPLLSFQPGYDSSLLHGAKTLEAAKSAAQAHHEARVLSALEDAA